MRVLIEEQKVTLDDDSGNTIHITTDQLLEMYKILSTVVIDNNHFFFNTLEFTV